MWGRKSIYGKHVHEENKPAKSFVTNKKEKTVNKVKETKKENKQTQKNNKCSDFEAEYLKFIEELKNQNIDNN